MLTLTLLVRVVDASTSDEDVMNDRESAFTAYPLPMHVTDTCIVQGRGFVHQDAASMDIAGEWHLLRMEVVEA